MQTRMESARRALGSTALTSTYHMVHLSPQATTNCSFSGASWPMARIGSRPLLSLACAHQQEDERVTAWRLLSQATRCLHIAQVRMQQGQDAAHERRHRSCRCARPTPGRALVLRLARCSFFAAAERNVVSGWRSMAA